MECYEGKYILLLQGPHHEAVHQATTPVLSLPLMAVSSADLSPRVLRANRAGLANLNMKHNYGPNFQEPENFMGRYFAFDELQCQ